MKDRFRFMVWDKDFNKFLDKNEFFIKSFGGIGFYDHEGRGEFDPNRYIRQQCTGIKDSDEELIYEGYIISTSFKGGNVKHLIVYSNTNASFHTLQIPYTKFTNSGRFSQEWISEFGYQIIGNKFEHKHLLD